MKRFKTRRRRKHNMMIILLLTVLVTISLLWYYNHNISPKMLDIAKSKLEEITTLYIKKDITPIDADLSRLILTTKNEKNEILTVDVDMDYAYDIMIEILRKIQDNILTLESGDISYFKNNNELKSYNGSVYLLVPLGLAHEGVLFSNLGPKVPIKLSFFEHVLGTVETTVTGYGINNALLKVYLTVTLEQKLIIPYKEETFKRNFTLLLGSSIITGSVPTIYGGALNSSSNVIEVE